MNDLYDLSLTLSPPPVSALPSAIASVDLRCDALGLWHAGGVLNDPLAPDERESLEWYLEEYWKWPYAEFAESGRRVERLLIDVGRRLYRAVFDSREAASIVRDWEHKQGSGRQISIISALPAALNLPWELLHDERGFLALRTREPIPILRRLPQAERAARPLLFAPPLRVLLVTARPHGAGAVDHRSIARELYDEVQSQIQAGRIELDFLRPPTLKALRERLRRDPQIHVLHFDGHGVFDLQPDAYDSLRLGGGRGKLVFEDEDGGRHDVDAEELGQVLQDSGVRLAVLTACQSAKGDSGDLFSSVAARLIQSGVDAVAAMGASVLVTTAAHYTEAFYRNIAGGKILNEAHERARQALHDDPRRHLNSHRSDQPGIPVVLRDWWVPHFYQQRPVTLIEAGSESPISLEHAGTGRGLPGRGQFDRLPGTLPPEPRYGFQGRSSELQQIERWLTRGKLVVIHGLCDVGKTALVRKAADDLTLPGLGMYTHVCFVSFEHGGDATMLLSSLGHQLGICDGGYDPSKPGEALKRLQATVERRSVLVLADNLESVLPGGEAPLDLAARAQLFDVLLSLREIKCGVLLTTRDTNFGDGRMAPGQQVKYLGLGGLYPEDAYALASCLLKDFEIPVERAPYQDLRDLLSLLDYHPLSIQLVLPALRSPWLSAFKIRRDFAELLHEFKDDATTGRTRSLTAALEYAMRLLTPDHQDAVKLLAQFVGGATEDNLLAVTRMAVREWATLRLTLEQSALLVPERVHEDISIPFLRFHPVLTPFLRGKLGAEAATLETRFANHYRTVARRLYEEDFRNPLPTRELARRELPNLRRALELLLQTRALAEAAEVEECLASFLSDFGMGRERDELRRLLAAASAANEQAGAGLTLADFLYESGLGVEEYNSRSLPAALNRFSQLLERIIAQPEGAPLGKGSYEHCLTLHRLARCLYADGQLNPAEGLLQQALLLLADRLTAKQPHNQTYLRERGTLLTALGDVLTDQGKYADAQAAYDERLELARQQNDLRGQGVALGQLGELARRQRNYAEAQRRFREALARFQELNVPKMEGVYWHQLGLVAQNQQQWAEAGRCYRESLAIKERQGDAAGAATTCNQLAIVARSTGKQDEAAGWMKLALNTPGLPAVYVSAMSSNLAELIKEGVKAGRMPKERLAEARSAAELSIEIDEDRATSSDAWKALSLLADIAEMEGQAEEASGHRRRAHETYAAHTGHRQRIDRDFGEFIANVAAGPDNELARAAVEEALPGLESEGWRLTLAVRRIQAGERDWRLLAEALDCQEALLVRRVLETIAEQSDA
jgi:tetratricopeptide (TPR) repeat protein